MFSNLLYFKSAKVIIINDSGTIWAFQARIFLGTKLS